MCWNIHLFLVCLLSEYGQGRYWDGHSETRGLGGRKTWWWRAADQVLPCQWGPAGPRAGAAEAPQEGPGHLRRETHTHSLTLYELHYNNNQRLAKQRLLGGSRWLLGHCYVLLFIWKCFMLGAQSENRLKADVRFSVTVRNIGWEIKKVASLYTSDLQL